MDIDNHSRPFFYRVVFLFAASSVHGRSSWKKSATKSAIENGLQETECLPVGCCVRVYSPFLNEVIDNSCRPDDGVVWLFL